MSRRGGSSPRPLLPERFGVQALGDLAQALDDARARARDEVVVEDDDAAVLDRREALVAGARLESSGVAAEPLVAR